MGKVEVAMLRLIENRVTARGVWVEKSSDARPRRNLGRLETGVRRGEPEMRVCKGCKLWVRGKGRCLCRREERG